MSDYKRKLRSAKPEPESQQDLYQDGLLYREEEPKTPPSQSIEPYFPPSPFGRKRHQPHGDR